MGLEGGCVPHSGGEPGVSLNSCLLGSSLTSEAKAPETPGSGEHGGAAARWVGAGGHYHSWKQGAWGGLCCLRRGRLPRSSEPSRLRPRSQVHLDTLAGAAHGSSFSRDLAVKTQSPNPGSWVRSTGQGKARGAAGPRSSDPLPCKTSALLPGDTGLDAGLWRIRILSQVGALGNAPAPPW